MKTFNEFVNESKLNEASIPRNIQDVAKIVSKNLDITLTFAEEIESPIPEDNNEMIWVYNVSKWGNSYKGINLDGIEFDIDINSDGKISLFQGGEPFNIPGLSDMKADWGSWIASEKLTKSIFLKNLKNYASQF